MDRPSTVLAWRVRDHRVPLAQRHAPDPRRDARATIVTRHRGDRGGHPHRSAHQQQAPIDAGHDAATPAGYVSAPYPRRDQHLCITKAGPNAAFGWALQHRQQQTRSLAADTPATDKSLESSESGQGRLLRHQALASTSRPAERSPEHWRRDRGCRQGFKASRWRSGSSAIPSRRFRACGRYTKLRSRVAGGTNRRTDQRQPAGSGSPEILLVSKQIGPRLGPRHDPDAREAHQIAGLMQDLRRALQPATTRSRNA
jgi:hypothetical protein